MRRDMALDGFFIQDVRLCFCYAAHMLCYAASVAIIQDAQLCFCYAAHMLCYAASVPDIHVLLFRFILERGVYFFLLRGHNFSMKTISGVL